MVVPLTFLGSPCVGLSSTARVVNMAIELDGVHVTVGSSGARIYTRNSYRKTFKAVPAAVLLRTFPLTSSRKSPVSSFAGQSITS